MPLLPLLPLGCGGKSTSLVAPATFSMHTVSLWYWAMVNWGLDDNESFPRSWDVIHGGMDKNGVF